MLSTVQLIQTSHKHKRKVFSLSLDYFTMFEIVRMQTVCLNLNLFIKPHLASMLVDDWHQTLDQIILCNLSYSSLLKLCHNVYRLQKLMIVVMILAQSSILSQIRW